VCVAVMKIGNDGGAEKSLGRRGKKKTSYRGASKSVEVCRHREDK